MKLSVLGNNNVSIFEVNELHDCAKSITFIVIDITYLITYIHIWTFDNELQDLQKTIYF